MTSRSAFWSSQAALIDFARPGPMPSTSRRRPDWLEMMSNVRTPNLATILSA